ncbi:hypothetical protein [Carboxylicivirga sp. N1Y90]|uniref:hypothetical protein n=1 Tax=Carboxylicivirga fragile TaxID=3417571 RepID=UPI003D336B94|nr:hypothetical protein [Marinilabiliaceae bacterium N1Y90]
MKKYILIFAISLIAIKGLCQSIEPHISIGYGQYNMDNIKAIQAEMYIPYGLPMQTTSSFPGYLNFEGGINYLIKEGRYKFGVLMGYQSTSGRLSIEDYSGVVAFDQLLSAINYSGLLSTRFLQKKGFNFYLTLKPGFIVTKYEEKREYPEYASRLNKSRLYNGNSFILDSNIEIVKVFKHFNLFAQCGYAYDSKTSLTTNNTDFWTVFEEDKEADWSGLRVKCGVSFNIQRQ